jgi:hypothetical protein
LLKAAWGEVCPQSSPQAIMRGPRPDDKLEPDLWNRVSSNNSPLSLMVTMTLFGNMASRVQGDVYFTGVHEIIALTNLPPFHHMQRPFIVKKHSALGNTFPIVVGFRVSA